VKEHFPALVDPASLPRRVLCVAPHPDDEVIGCGGVLAMHAGRGDAVRVVLATGGAERTAESRAALAVLGVRDVVALELEDGRLGAAYELVERLRAQLDDHRPALIYAPGPFEHHPDHRACHRALLAAAAGGGASVLGYGVNTGVSTPLPGPGEPGEPGGGGAPGL
jgi:LmbE family N-acetylglucosaminyl deacetylase